MTREMYASASFGKKAAACLPGHPSWRWDKGQPQHHWSTPRRPDAEPATATGRNDPGEGSAADLGRQRRHSWRRRAPHRHTPVAP